MSVYKIIQNKTELEELIHHVHITKYASFDYETSGVKYYNNTEYPLTIGTSFQPGSAHILPLGHFESPFKNNWQKLFRIYSKEILENPDVTKVAWNIKFEQKWGFRYGSIMKGRMLDGMLAKYCLDEERPHDLKNFVSNMFPEFDGYEDEVDLLVKKYGGWAKVPLDPLCKYNGLDCDLTLRGMIMMEKKLMRMDFYNLFRNLLMMSSRVLAESEYRGLMVDRGYLESLMDTYKIKIKAAEDKLNSNPAVIKYNRHQKRWLIREWVDEINLEIEGIRKEDKKTGPRMIAHREKKIKGYYEGKFSNKESDLVKGINFGSSKQLVDFFYTKKYGLKLPILEYTKDKKTKKNTNTPSTAEDVIERLKPKDKAGVIDDLLALRGLTKLDSTYISGMHPLLDHFDRVHATFHIQGTVTGRLSCVEPNLQNIPRDTTASDIKKMFIPPPGFILLEVDYSQAELRVVAELAKDKAMIDIFKRNYNIHVATACLINGGLQLYDKVKGILKKADELSGEELKKPENKELLFWTKEKKRAKTINFGILYGQGPKKLSVELECSEDEAQEFINLWFRAYPQVAKWIKNQVKFAKQNGYVLSIFGRKRRLPDIWSDKFGFRSEAERQAVNTPIQGGASDFGLLSQVVIREKIMAGELPRDMYQVYTVHDSIGFYIRPTDIHRVVPQVVKICDNPDTLKYFGFQLTEVMMKVASEAGKNWGEKGDYDAWTNYIKLVA